MIVAAWARQRFACVRPLGPLPASAFRHGSCERSRVGKRSSVEISYPVVLIGRDVDSTQSHLPVSEVNVRFTIPGQDTTDRPDAYHRRRTRDSLPAPTRDRAGPNTPPDMCVWLKDLPGRSTPADRDNPSCVERLERGPRKWKAAPPHHVGMRPLPGEASSYFRGEATARHTHAR